MSKVFVCYTDSTSEHQCKKNHGEISGDMEGAGVLNIFNLSLHTQVIFIQIILMTGTANHTKGWLQGTSMIPT
jgi:hypothetical protein